MTELLTAQMRDAVGAEVDRRGSYPIAASDIRRWVVATYYPRRPPEYLWDEDAAKRAGRPGLLAPEEFNPFAWMLADPPGPPDVGEAIANPDYFENRAGVEGPGLRTTLNAGVVVEYGTRMRPGDVITSVTRLGPYEVKQGKRGPMLLSRLVDTWTNQDGATTKTAPRPRRRP